MCAKYTEIYGDSSSGWGLEKMGVLNNAPQGFAEAVSMLNALPQSLLAEIVMLPYCVCKISVF